MNQFEMILQDLDDKNLRRSLKDQLGPQSRELIVNGRRVLNFCSNNYLGLANDFRLVQAAQQALEEAGVGAGASRLVCGNMTAHQELETYLASFKGTEAALVFSTGYMANVGTISALFGRDDVIFSDKLNHASIVDGIVLSRATMKRYPHKDMSALEKMLEESDSKGQKVIITDSVFSMDGDIAPLDQIVDLAQKYHCRVMVDEAHALGVLGKNGKGAVEHFNLEGKIDIQMGTLSKAVGSFGAYICGSRAMIDVLINSARSFIYTTGMPPAIAAASLEGLQIIEKDKNARQRLWSNTDYVVKHLRSSGWNLLDSATPIIPLMVKDDDVAIEFSRRLFEEDIMISAIRPPTVPKYTARLRMTIMTTHTSSDLDYCLSKVESIGKEMNLI